MRWYEAGKIVRRERGEWHFAWVLEGRAVQDVWIVPRREERNDGADLYEYGTSIRFYDSSVPAWRSHWVGPMQRFAQSFIARAVDGDVTLETDRADGAQLRWIFSDITPHGFTWRNLLLDRGDWTLTQDFIATRS